ncbi:Sll0314/Alr1548 family TPR repeat-containing protein [Chamaesiphon sp.]|uniref:Sll0314/Alr1548 family TPR repeat-containing protein n=1 Tax=Chamaesiphon sp. TaxID=2814140 RepID=UPI003594167B
MKFKFSVRSLLALATGVTLTQSAILAPMSQFNPTITSVVASPKTSPKLVKPNSNMILPAAGSRTKQGANVERAKEAMFRDGDYAKAKQYLDLALKTDPNEPLTYAMSTLYPFSAGDFEQVKVYGDKTTKAAEQLMKINPLRGNLYQGVGLAILGAYEMKKPSGGALGALGKLQMVFEYMDKAKKLDPNNPELNLIKGYMDLLLAVNVPFADTNQAIEQLKNAQPRYLALRGLYIGHRDLKEYDKANNAIDAARKIAPQNPELTYYKAQLLGIRGREQRNDNDLRESIKLFESAYQKRNGLLLSTIAQILSERCQAKSSLAQISSDACYGFEAQLKQDNPNLVIGLTILPVLN